MTKPFFRAVGDRAVLVELADTASDEANRQAIELDRAINGASIAGIVETVPALVNVLVVFDPLETDHSRVTVALQQLFPLAKARDTNGAEHMIDVCYDLAVAPDLEAVANACGMTPDAVAKAHSDAWFRVSMYGFYPGYAYLSGLPSSIQVPRKKNAVRDVPAGSVIIAGTQSLITTITMPTGWSVIGRTDAKVITGDDHQPFLFGVGDRVQFRPVSHSTLRAKP